MQRTSLNLLALGFFLTACSARPAVDSPSTFYVFRLDPPGLVEFSAELQPARSLPLALPPECSLFNGFPAPTGPMIAIELSCPVGQTVMLLNTDTGTLEPAYPNSDSHYLAWTADGRAVFLRVDSMTSPRILRLGMDGGGDFLPIPGLAYDLASQPDSRDFSFTFTRGLGYGSETWLARDDGSLIRQILADPVSIISFVRWSPDGKQLAFIKFPDSQTPYPQGELWLSEADGSKLRYLAQADAGHGYPPAWSPDGRRLAFVYRENPAEPGVEQSESKLVSDIHVVDVASGQVSPLTRFQEARVEAPVWSPDGNTLAVTAILNDKMNVYLVNSASGELQPIPTDPACCAGWLRK